jgi:hypothetical protein
VQNKNKENKNKQNENMSTAKQTTDWAPWTPQELAKRVEAGVEQYKKIKSSPNNEEKTDEH